VLDVTVPGLEELLRESSVIGDEFKFDLAAYLAKIPNAPVRSLGEILDRGLNHAELEATFRLRNQPDKRETEHYRQAMIKRRTLRAAVMATLEELRIDALAYPTLRRKPSLIGEAQGGTNCQLSATTGLPAIAMPAGFSTDGLPIALELLGGAWEEAKLLKYAYAWEQATKPRRPPFSTPPLVKGVAPATTVADIAIGSATVKLAYDPTTGALRYEAAAPKLAVTDRVVALTIQRTDGEKPGPIIAQLLAPNQIAGSGVLTMRGRNREDLVDGKLVVQFYTRTAPLGVERQRITLRPAPPISPPPKGQ
jgi:amidase